MMNSIIIFDFTKGVDARKWQVVNDDVMGGVSSAKMGIDKEGYGVFAGHVSLDNNGGFSSVRYVAGTTGIKGYSKFVINLKGDGKPFQFRVKSASNTYYSYYFNFETTGQWQKIKIPFNKMTPSFRGRDLDMANFSGEYLEEIGFLIGNKKEEDFKLMIDNIGIE